MNTNKSDEMNGNGMNGDERAYDLLCRAHFGEASVGERAELEGLLAASEALREQKAELEATTALVRGALVGGEPSLGRERMDTVRAAAAGAGVLPIKTIPRRRYQRPLEVMSVAAGVLFTAGLLVLATKEKEAAQGGPERLDRNDETVALGGFDPHSAPPASGGFNPNGGAAHRGLDKAVLAELEGTTALGVRTQSLDGEAPGAGGYGSTGLVQLDVADPAAEVVLRAEEAIVGQAPVLVRRSFSAGGTSESGRVVAVDPDAGPEVALGHFSTASATRVPMGGSPNPSPLLDHAESSESFLGTVTKVDGHSGERVRINGELQGLWAGAGGGGGGDAVGDFGLAYGGAFRGPGDGVPPPSASGSPPPSADPGLPSPAFREHRRGSGGGGSRLGLDVRYMSPEGTPVTKDMIVGMKELTGKKSDGFRSRALRHTPTRIPNERPRDMFFRFWGDNPYVVTDIDAQSTFAADVDTASFGLAERMLTQGIRPTREQIRTEEFVNYLTPDLEAPAEAAFAIHSELSPSPFSPGKERYLLRVGVRAKEVAKDERPALALTFVVDVSGSMEQENRLELVKHAMRLLGSQLEAKDTIAIVSFSNEAKLVLEATSAARADVIEGALFGLAPGGGTNADAGLALGYQVAAAQAAPGAQRRVVFLSDGVANIGETDQAKLATRATEGSEQRIFLNTIGVGLENHNDLFLEQLADKGDGVCDYVADAKSARRAIVDRFTGGFVTVAKDAKIQVEFDAGTVLRWRQLGYENRAIADKDFRNDAVDAAEIGAGHQVTCLYEVELDRSSKPVSEEAALAMVRVRWQPIDGDSAGAFTELEAPVNFTRDSRDTFRGASHGFRRAALAAQLAECLRASIHTAGDSVKDLGLELAQLLSEDRHDDTARLAVMTKAAIDLGLRTRPLLASTDPDAAHRRAYHEALIESLGGVVMPSKTVTGGVEVTSTADELEEQLREILEKRRQEKAR